MVLASRHQYPVKLAYALTTHRAQGQTLEQVVVDCNGVRNAGQIGVAVGRAVSVDGLQVLNYSRSAAALKHPMLVYEYNSTSSQPVQDNLSCCKIPYVIPQDIEHGCRREEASAPHADVEEEEDVEDVQGDLSFPFDQNTFFDGPIELPSIQTTISLEV